MSRGFWIVGIYIFLLFSRLHDNIPSLHLPIVFQLAGFVAVLVSGHLTGVLRNPIMLCLAGFTAWMFTTIPFSVWPGGTVRCIQNWLQCLALYLLITALAPTSRHVQKATVMLVLGVFAGAVTVTVRGEEVLGRAMGSGRLGDPNELALFMLLGVTLLCGLLGGALFIRVPLFLMGIFMFLVFMRTGSRGGFVGLVVTMLAMFFLGDFRRKLVTALLGLLALASMFLFAPHAALTRYQNVLGIKSSDATSQIDLAAEGSADSRTYLLRKSIELTVRHPIFGVGTGMFAVAEDVLAKDIGLRRGEWHETHNMYTQVSSENGIPALILFLGACLGACHRLNKLCRKASALSGPVAESIGRQATWLRLGLIGFLATGAFLSVAYSEVLVTMLALSAALAQAAERELQFQSPHPNETATASVIRSSTSTVATLRPSTFPVVR